MTVKVKTNIKQVVDKIRKVFQDKIPSAESMEKLGEKSIELIRKRTRLGYGVATAGAKRGRLKQLSDDYIDFRREYGDLSPATRPAKSNLTLTGQMLDSMEVIEAKKGQASIAPTGNRFDTDHTNDEIALFCEKQGRKFLSLSDNEIKQLRRFYENEVIDQALKRGRLTR